MVVHTKQSSISNKEKQQELFLILGMEFTSIVCIFATSLHNDGGHLKILI
jgi:hypothetical protein